MAAASRSTHTALIVLGFLLILGAITYILHFKEYDNNLVITLVGLGFFIMVLSKWMFAKTGIVKVIKPYHHLGTGTVIVVLGFLLILFQITLNLMNIPVEARLEKIVPIIAIFLIILGYMISSSGKQRIRLEPES